MPIASQTDLCNLALAELGARRITSFESDTTVEAKACRLHLSQVRDSLLETHQWDFATHRSALAKLPPNPADTEYSECWQLPNDFIRLIRISGNSALNSVQTFAREGQTLLTRHISSATLPIVYIRSSVDVNLWPALFVDAVAYKLAARIAGDVTQNPALANDALQKLQTLALPAAQTSDARQTLSGENFGPFHMLAQSPLVAARLNHSSSPHLIPPPA